MPVRINLGAWSSVFAVPSCVADEHLRIASHNQLKVLLFLLRNNDKNFTYKALSDELRIHEEDVKDCISFWIDRGVLAEVSGELVPEKGSAQAQPEPEPSADKPEPKVVLSRPSKPDIVTAAQRVSSDEDLSHVLVEVESALGKPLSSGNIATLVMLYDTCGLPAEVIVMLVNYCVSVGKANMRAIETIGVKWADDGIYSIEAAENKIRISRQADEDWTRVRSVFGLQNVGSPTVKQHEFAHRWISQWHFSDEMLREAYEICVDTKGEMKLGYINGILTKWHNSGIVSVSDIQKKDKKKTPKSGKKSDASYDIEELMKIK
ncbi:MAG: DnaD domain protein [Ruminococcus sp.]|nr:DnaD domain protein [Ruminococcus sp.]